MLLLRRDVLVDLFHVVRRALASDRRGGRSTLPVQPAEVA
jgi:hypothetical protein